MLGKQITAGQLTNKDGIRDSPEWLEFRRVLFRSLTTSLFRVEQSSGLFLCRFHVVEGTTVNQAQALSWRLGRSHHQQSFDRSSSPTGPIKPWVDYLRETCCCLYHNLSLGVHQLVAIMPLTSSSRLLSLCCHRSTNRPCSSHPRRYFPAISSACCRS